MALIAALTGIAGACGACSSRSASLGCWLPASRSRGGEPLRSERAAVVRAAERHGDIDGGLRSRSPSAARSQPIGGVAMGSYRVRVGRAISVVLTAAAVAIRDSSGDLVRRVMFVAGQTWLSDCKSLRNSLPLRT